MLTKEPQLARLYFTLTRISLCTNRNKPFINSTPAVFFVFIILPINLHSKALSTNEFNRPT
jgi:hypothetical protein